MKRLNSLPWIAFALVWMLHACNYTEGMCHPRGEGGLGDGVGGGVISPNGSGGFGDVPPQPQDASGPMPPDCNMVPNDPCHQKCLTDYEETAVKCAQIQEESVRRFCQEAAYQTYKACKDACQQSEDCKEQCKKQCDKIHDRCHADCTKNDPTSSCHDTCNQEYSQCLKECDKECK